jgi:hypothetical protein
MPHHVVVLALPAVVAFDLAIPAQVFGQYVEHDRYTFTVGAGRIGAVPSTTGFAIQAPRTFARQFVEQTGTTPLRWLTAQRLLEARRLLEVSDLPIEELARRCGLGTATNLRVHLARDAATTPTAYRAAFHGTGNVSGNRHRTTSGR